MKIIIKILGLFFSLIILGTLFLWPTEGVYFSKETKNNLNDNGMTYNSITLGVNKYVRLAPAFIQDRNENNTFLLKPFSKSENAVFDYGKDSFSIMYWLFIICAPSLLITLLYFLLIVSRKKQKPLEAI